MCGEKSWTPALCAGGQGSPPRVRGKVTQHLLPALCCGITPACAGKRCRPEYRNGGNQDHPRVCGEKGKWAQSQTISAGSPPRVRGKVRHARIDCARFGITPACAGKSGCCNPDPQGQRDHPRVCGEKAALKDPIPARLGSPPRVRGKVLAALMPENRVGITPACAGKRGSQHCKQQPDRDHPRVCGEKVGGISARSCCTGSPPRVRGKVFKYVAYLNGFRITPACAGKSSGAFSPGFQT